MSYKLMKENLLKKVLDVLKMVDEIEHFINNIDTLDKRDKNLFNLYCQDLKMKLLTIK